MKIKPDNKYLFISAILGLIFIINIIIGKVALLFKFKQPIVIGDVGEFLILFCTVIFFIFGVLICENKVIKSKEEC